VENTKEGFFNVGNKASGVQNDIMRIIIIWVYKGGARKGFAGLLTGLSWG
jgi:hypothetical protein